ncbi:MAG: glycosyltransferase family 4 protein [Magnetovibrio sp.]|nr:glycosyltransferase family 4 protein [Magnetovibrio sp.]
MKVCVSVHGRFHAFELARGLAARGCLGRLITTYPAGVVRRVVGDGADVRTEPWLEARRRAGQWLGANGSRLDVAIQRRFGAAAARHLPAEGDVFVGWSAASLEAIPAARERGMRIVIERGSTHIEHQTETLRDLYARHGLSFGDTAPETIERELAEYETADAIAVPSGFAADTFVKRGVPAAKLIVNPYGVDLSAFAPGPDRAADAVPRILFVGRVGFRKGVIELLAAFRALAGAAELHLIGPVEDAIRPFLSEGPADGVFVRGALAADRLADAYRAADIFCLPSWEEGFPLVLLQAMASGLPVVVTRATGAADMITAGQEGEIVQPGDIDGLTGALAALVDDGERRERQGAAARARVAGGWSWDDYVDRAVDHYRALMEGAG